MEGSDVRGKGYYCLRFAHYQNSYHIGELRVYDRIGKRPRQTLWSLAGDFGPKWHTAAVQLNLTSVTQVGVFHDRYMTCISSGKIKCIITRGRAQAHAYIRHHSYTHTRPHA